MAERQVCDQSACPCFAIGLSFPDHDFPLSPFYSLDCLLAVSLTHHRSQATRGIAPQPRRVRVCASASNHATIHSISVSTQAKSLAKSSREPDSRLYIPHSLWTLRIIPPSRFLSTAMIPLIAASPNSSKWTVALTLSFSLTNPLTSR